MVSRAGRRGPFPRAWSTLLLTLGMCCAAALPTHAVLVQGFVKDEGGTGVAQSGVDFVEQTTSQAFSATTNALGFYFLDVPVGVYETSYIPPDGSGLAPRRAAGVSIATATTLADVVLVAGFVVSGTVVDELGFPVSSIDLNLIDRASGLVAFTPNDNTDTSGAYSVLVPAGVYDIAYRPPSSSTLAPAKIYAIAVGADTVLPAVTLAPGVVLTGRVVDGVGNGVEAVDLDFFDALTRLSVYTIRDHTDPTGAFRVVVRPGSFNIQFSPPEGTRLVGARLADVTATADLMLPDLTLVDGIEMTGRVIAAAGGSGVADVDLDFFDAPTGLAVFVPRDWTLADGSYRVFVPAGRYNLHFEPPAGGRLLSVRLADVDLTADVQLPDVVLDEGFLLSGRVLETLGAAIPGVDLDLYDAASGLKVFTSNDNSGADGTFSVPVPAGTFNVQFVPPADSHFQPLRLTSVVITGDLSLPDTVLDTGVAVAGTAVDGLGAPAPRVDVDVLDSVSGASVFVVHDNTDTLGRFRTVVAPGNYLIQLQPAVDTRLRPLRTAPMDIAADVDLGLLVLESGYQVGGAVTDANDLPLADVDIDFVDPVSGAHQLLLGDHTDATGGFLTVVGPGTYRVQYEPPPATRFRALEVDAVPIAGDTTLPTAVLVEGTLVSGTVVSPTRTPVGGVDTDWYLAETCAPVFTVRDTTDPTGHFEVALAPGSYTLLLRPQAASGLRPKRVPAVSVGATDLALASETLSATVDNTDPCDGLDNDCDGTIDEGYAGLGATCSVGVGQCAASGLLVCSADGLGTECDAVPGTPVPETCDGVDNDCDGTIDNGVCAPVAVDVTVDGNTVAWSAAAGATGYDVVLGDLTTLRASAGDFGATVTACAADDYPTESVVVAELPAPGGGLWILVRTVDAGGPGSYGSAVRDAGLAGATASCP